MNSTNSPFYSPLDSVAQSASNGNNIPDITTDPRWKVSSIETLRWNQNYPYQLMVLEYVNGKYSVYKGMIFTLPINPQELSIDMPFAINTTVTTTGIIEEHNGSPIRPINLSGTTGVLPLKGHAEAWIDRYSNPTDAIIADSLNIGTVATQTFKSVVGGNVSSSNINENLTEEQLQTTEYNQFRLLQKFLETYITLKKTTAGKNLRLAFAIWKDQAIYLVTPILFRVRKSSSRALEYEYQLGFKGWGRIEIDEVVDTSSSWVSVAVDKVAMAQKIYSRVVGSAYTIQNAKETITSLVADSQENVFEVCRQVKCTLKNTLGYSWSITDLPNNLVYLLTPSIENALSDPTKAKRIKESYQGSNVSVDKAWDKMNKELNIAPHNATEAGPLLSGTGNVTFSRPNPNTPLLSGPPSVLLNDLSIEELKINSSTQQKIRDEQQRVQNLTAIDYQSMRDKLATFVADFTTMVGGGDSTYDAIYNRTNQITPIKTTPSDSDYEIIYAINEILMALDKIIISTDPQQSIISPVEYIAGLARQSGIAFTSPVSKFAVPFSYNSTLEQLSLKYLGTPDRWHEIAALNGLRDPYVDEEGFDLFLLTNGRNNQVTVSYTTNLYVGQYVWISSNTVSRTKRKIVGLEKVGSNLIVTVDGDQDMGDYKVLSQAKLHAYLPDTVNSQMLIYIPSTDAPQQNAFRGDKIPTTEESQALLSVGGVDLMVKSNMDLAITPNGDCPFSVGFTNLIQRLRIGLSTPIGTLLHHPEYGIPIPLGASVADVDPNELKRGIQNFLAMDKAFTGINGVSISQQGPALKINVNVGISGISENIPIITTVKP